eukprot:scaffold114354_cov35-Tisochrysis_lutea.AAC.1
MGFIDAHRLAYTQRYSREKAPRTTYPYSEASSSSATKQAACTTSHITADTPDENPEEPWASAKKAVAPNRG